MKKFRVKFNDFYCRSCGTQLYIDNIYRILNSQYEPNTNCDGYISILTAKCTCGHRYKIICDCHEANNCITVCAQRVIKLSWGEYLKNYRREQIRKELSYKDTIKQCTYDYKREVKDIGTWRLTPEQIEEYLNLPDDEKKTYFKELYKGE